MAAVSFGVSLEKNKAAVRTPPTDFFGSHFFEPNWNLREKSAQEYARARAERLMRRMRLVGF